MNKKKGYQEPTIDTIKMRHLPCLQNTSPFDPAEDPDPDPYQNPDPNNG